VKAERLIEGDKDIMNVRIGLYDFFAYTVPGGVYLFTLGYILVRLQVIQVNQQIQDFLLSATGLVLLTLASYVSGLVFDFFTSGWIRLFRSKNFSQKIFDEFTRVHPQIEVKFKASDWQILIARIRQENAEIGSTIEQNNVTNLMLRNLSFGFLLFGSVQLIEFFLTRSIISIVLAIISAFFCIFSQRQSTKFVRLFFIQIFEYTAAKSLSDVKLVEYKFPVETAPIIKDEVMFTLPSEKSKSSKATGLGSKRSQAK
jgi:hypothetical protein